MNALIGHSGFVGSSLLEQTSFDHLYRSTDIAEIRGQRFDTLVCAGAPGHKWLANREPDVDQANIERLMENLVHVRCNRFVLISTVDVFQTPVGVDECSPVDESRLSPYGLHRRQLERFVQEQFPAQLTLRLPGLVGPRLRKNLIFDMLNRRDLRNVDSRGQFQFYPVTNLWRDIQVAQAARLQLVHLAVEPISVTQIAQSGFSLTFRNQLDAAPVQYDMQSRHADIFGARGRYQYGAKESLQAIIDYARSEPLSLPAEGGVMP
ncbi:nucleoside-diphosphate-sugar epimerase [Metapseudomonas resinovorans]|uniref:pyridine nucleotide transhydrogenase n=1 Tax=Metapseudomonas resinovorans TaxID=53412 RepID=UPI003D216DCC